MNGEAKGNEAEDAESKIRSQQQYFGFYVRRYYQQLITTPVEELKEVPVRINEDGE